MQETHNKKSISFAGILLGISFICLAAVLFLVISFSVIRIEEGERGVVISPYGFRAPYGYLDETLTSGLHLIVPGERVQIYDVSPQTYILSSPDSAEATTLDGKTVFVEASVTYVLDSNKIVEIHINWQNRYESELVRPLLKSITRNAISSFNYSEIDGQPSQLEEVIYGQLKAELNKNFLTLLKFSILSIQLSE